MTGMRATGKTEFDDKAAVVECRLAWMDGWIQRLLLLQRTTTTESCILHLQEEEAGRLLYILCRPKIKAQQYLVFFPLKECNWLYSRLPGGCFIRFAMYSLSLSVSVGPLTPPRAGHYTLVFSYPFL